MYAPSPVFSPLVGMGAKIGLKAFERHALTPLPSPPVGRGQGEGCRG